ncbi:hypothetical protein DSM106972_099540 [Dulcicalothrix desertica PCC 7102]|uniref:Plasmid pRiA4b Orf3-like domain-containing protein n=2 Tax=Dulcicalothrix desertica TaxID=32056 RepID=A0A433UEN4_9CYAN|nr:plasmid pRiA4b ORF-3 family protein [Dulcicalothrix desertica]RUS92294.1 hypothetical protein DSM106972_099540 [Dulcicalothrix desertica PCC 7102]TWH61337.1 pRiA4b ORF-3-like protein [Dulcicalothrix desertica PCC 7102]
MSNSSEPIVYQLKILLLGISPAIWRRVLVTSNSTIEDLHYTIQLAMGWSDMHLHNFRIHGRDYGITRTRGKIFSDLASEVKLATFGFREKEKFLYEYDFSISPVPGGAWRHWWRHQIRVEAIKVSEQDKFYPVCTGGKSVCPPEGCGGPWGFMKAREEFSLSIPDVLERFASILRNKKIDMSREEAAELRDWLAVYRNEFDCQKVNQHLLKYFTGDRESLFFSEGIE